MRPEPRVHSGLDDWGLDPYEFRLLFRISRRAGQNGTCTESIPNMAKACRMSHNTVRKALATLVRLGMIKSAERPGQTAEYVLCPVSEWKEKKEETPTKSGRGTKSGSTKSGKGPLPDLVGVPLPDQGDEGIPSEGIPIKDSLKDKPSANPVVRPPDGDGPGGEPSPPLNGTEVIIGGEPVNPDPKKQSLPEAKPPAEIKTLCSEWDFKAAQALLERLTELKVLSGIVRKQVAAKGAEHVINEWANTFRLLQTQDGWTTDQITGAMRWVLQKDNKWIKKRWLQSAQSLRQPTGTGDKTKFEAILNQAESDGKSQRSTGESTDEAKQRLLAVALRTVSKAS